VAGAVAYWQLPTADQLHSEGFGTVHLASELIATAKGLR
jgi:hypothetical protein